MPEIQAWECDGCGALGKSRVVEVGDPESPDKTHRAYQPPEDWYYVAVQHIGHDNEPAKLFCTERCMGYYFRPMKRRSGSNGQSVGEEAHTKR